MKIKDVSNATWVGHIIILLIFGLLSYKYRMVISYEDMLPTISILQNTSGMIFTIMGIWIAYLYPNAILKIITPDKVGAIFSESDEARIKQIVGLVATSAFVAGCLIIGSVAIPFITKSNTYFSLLEYYTFFGTFTLLILTYAQLFCVYLVIISNINFIFDFDNYKTKTNLANRLSGKHKK
jgi:hypothetical protein